MSNYLVFFIIDLVSILLGSLFLKFPPKRINGLYGYRTNKSMKTQENWDFSQRYSSKLLIVFFGALLLLSVFLYFLKVELGTIGISILFGLHILAIVFLLFKTESQLKKMSNNKE